jgi:tetratricopeptide (TPR) repeat protein
VPRSPPSAIAAPRSRRSSPPRGGSGGPRGACTAGSGEGPLRPRRGSPRRIGIRRPDRERLAFYLFRAGRFREAHELYAELAKAGGRADLEVNDGASLARLGDDVKAKAAFERALAIEPAQPLAKLYLGNALLRMGDTAGAASTYQAFLTEFPTGAPAEQVRRVLAELTPGTTP